jgi:alpha 1,3-glucosidase
MFNRKSLACGNLHTSPSKAAAFEKTMKDVRVEKVVIVGVSDEWLEKQTAKVEVDGETWEVDITVTKSKDGKVNVATVRDPRVPITQDWKIAF